MSIAVSNIYALVANTVSDCQSGESHINQQTNVAVTNIVDSDALYPGRLAAPIHLMVQIMLADGENAVIGFCTVEHFNIVLHLLREEIRHQNFTITFLGLRCSYDILPLEPLIGFCDGEYTSFKIEVGGLEG